MPHLLNLIKNTRNLFLQLSVVTQNYRWRYLGPSSVSISADLYLFVTVGLEEGKDTCPQLYMKLLFINGNVPVMHSGFLT